MRSLVIVLLVAILLAVTGVGAALLAHVHVSVTP